MNCWWPRSRLLLLLLSLTLKMVIHQKPNQIISHQELTQHHSPSSCWVIIHQQVYDLTSFLDRVSLPLSSSTFYNTLSSKTLNLIFYSPSQHPGGPEVILRYAGSDASEAFDTVHALSILDTLPATCSLGRSEPAPPPALDNKLPLTTPKLPNLSHIINLTDLESAAEVGLKPKAWGRSTNLSWYKLKAFYCIRICTSWFKILIWYIFTYSISSQQPITSPLPIENWAPIEINQIGIWSGSGLGCYAMFLDPRSKRRRRSVVSVLRCQSLSLPRPWVG